MSADKSRDSDNVTPKRGFFQENSGWLLNIRCLIYIGVIIDPFYVKKNFSLRCFYLRRQNHLHWSLAVWFWRNNKFMFFFSFNLIDGSIEVSIIWSDQRFLGGYSWFWASPYIHFLSLRGTPGCRKDGAQRSLAPHGNSSRFQNCSTFMKTFICAT